jgi:hypothetical protein
MEKLLLAVVIQIHMPSDNLFQDPLEITMTGVLLRLQ